MRLQIGQPPSPTFADPLGLLSDCHRRVEYFLGVLARVGTQAGSEALGDTERDALATALRYFREAAPRHTADEEESLFPRLRRSDLPEAVALLARLDALEADHQAAAPDHALVEALGQLWLNTGRLSVEDRTRYAAAVARLLERYRQHIHVEDHEVFPLAAQALTLGQLKEVGREMAGRRAVSFPA